ncbi:hypothetical protein [Prevotellamassilia timonensis]
MNFNFNPQTYDFTSSIPDVFEMSDFLWAVPFLLLTSKVNFLMSLMRTIM